MSVADQVALHRESMRQQREILAAIEANTQAIALNTQALRELLAPPEQRIGGTVGIESGERLGKGRVTRR